MTVGPDPNTVGPDQGAAIEPAVTQQPEQNPPVVVANTATPVAPANPSTFLVEQRRSLTTQLHANATRSRSYALRRNGRTRRVGRLRARSC